MIQFFGKGRPISGSLGFEKGTLYNNNPLTNRADNPSTGTTFGLTAAATVGWTFTNTSGSAIPKIGGFIPSYDKTLSKGFATDNEATLGGKFIYAAISTPSKAYNYIDRFF